MTREATVSAGLAVVVVALYVSPEHIASALSLYQPGVEYVAGGIERCLLWLFVAGVAWGTGWGRLSRVALWPAYEGGLMAASRLALPMGKPVDNLPPGVNMADVAFGPAATWISVGIAFWGAAYVAAGLRGGRGAGG